MALERTVQVWGAEQQTRGGLTIARAVAWPGIARVGQTAETVASRFVAAAQKEWFDRGRVTPALHAFPAMTCEATRLTLDFGKRGFVLHFDVVLARLQNAVCALLPLRGACAFGADDASALAALEARLRMEASVERWLDDGATLWPLQIGAGVTLVPLADVVRFSTFGEVRELQKAREEAIVPKIASTLDIRRPTAFLREPEIAEILRVATGAHPTSIVLVGPSGAGRTAILKEAARRRAFPAGIRGTNAARLIQALTTRGGWQESLTKACEELAKSGEWLWVDHLADLFEVGRYAGNSVSIAEYLRPWLARGQIRVVGEATAEEIARIEARAPGWLEAFTRVPVPEPADPLPIVEAWAREAGDRVSPAGAAEALRLGRRFSPYAGFPGRTIRFLDALLATRARAEGPVDRDAVAAAFCAESGLPRMIVDPAVPLRSDAIAAWFHARVHGQPEAVRAVVDLLAAVKADVTPRGRPIASLLLVGPTGVGKTETARALATFLFGDPSRMTRFDMGEFTSPGAVLRLVGIGDEEGLLTAAIRRQPFSVLLFDEVEKADPAFLDLLLQLLGEGRLTDGKGRVADACATIVLLTSNVGAAEARRTPSGFDRAGEAGAAVGRTVERAVAKWLRPELHNRLDRVLAFQPLGATRSRACSTARSRRSAADPASVACPCRSRPRPARGSPTAGSRRASARDRSSAC